MATAAMTQQPDLARPYRLWVLIGSEYMDRFETKGRFIGKAP